MGTDEAGRAPELDESALRRLPPPDAAHRIPDDRAPEQPDEQPEPDPEEPWWRRATGG